MSLNSVHETAQHNGNYSNRLKRVCYTNLSITKSYDYREVAFGKETNKKTYNIKEIFFLLMPCKLFLFLSILPVSHERFV